MRRLTPTLTSTSTLAPGLMPMPALLMPALVGMLVLSPAAASTRTAASAPVSSTASAVAPRAPHTPTAASAGAQTIVDRIVAIVGDQVITLSDVRVARAFGLVGLSSVRSGAVAWAATVGGEAGMPAANSPAGGTATESQAVEFLVERELMRAEVERFGAGEPPAAQVDARTKAVQARFSSPDAYRAALEAHGLSEARFRAWLADDVRIEQYVEQRFGASAQPTDEEVLQYYQSREREFSVGGRPRPFEEVRDMVRRQLGESRRQAMVDDWVSGLRRRTAVVMKSID